MPCLALAGSRYRKRQVLARRSYLDGAGEGINAPSRVHPGHLKHPGGSHPVLQHHLAPGHVAACVARPVGWEGAEGFFARILEAPVPGPSRVHRGLEDRLAVQIGVGSVLPVVDRSREDVLGTVPAGRHAQQFGVENHAGAALRGQHDGVRAVAHVVAGNLVGARVLRLLHGDAGRDDRPVVHVEPRLVVAQRAVVEAACRKRGALVDPCPQDADLPVAEASARRGHQKVLLHARDQMDQAAVGAVSGNEPGLAGIPAPFSGLPAPEAVAVHCRLVPVAGVAVPHKDRVDIAHEVDLACGRCRQFRRTGRLREGEDGQCIEHAVQHLRTDHGCPPIVGKRLRGTRLAPCLHASTGAASSHPSLGL